MEETTEQPTTLLKHAIKWGAICGGISIFLSIMLYVIDYTLMVQLKFLLLFLAIYLGVTIYAGIDYRGTQGRFLPYGKAFQHGFILLAFSGLIATIWNFLLYNVIDTELPQKLMEATMENTRAMMENFGAPADSIDAELAKAEERTKGQFTPAGQALGFVYITIFSAVMALISAIFVKRNEPVEEM
ncbi:MAG: DUF4199 domain-containing protein [Cyclobacteriaceae bacterium]|nr:DUF4199 domain-containing protein [Cyclobacteriaceae bacterium]